VALAVTALVPAGGCASKMVSLRQTPHNPLAGQVRLNGWGGPKPSDRTVQFLRVYDLTEDWKGDPQALLQKVQAVQEREPSADKLYAIAELSYLQAKRVESSKPQLAMNFYGATVLNAYHYLFDDRFRATRNPYDPHFRGACDLYNAALEAGLRRVRKDQNLLPGHTLSIRTAAGNWDITCQIRAGNWRREDFGRFEFVSDYKIHGLENHYHTYGLGVPLIAVRPSQGGDQNEPPAASYYPKDLSFPVTAFLRPSAEDGVSGSTSGDSSRRHGVLELYDPLSVGDIVVSGVRIPLESDFTTPLAYFLSNPAFDVPTAGLLRPETLLAKANGTRPLMGLYMVQPYEPGKIPVLMVHGLWSSPMTWMAMFNDLRSIPEIRDRYQFWFYLYPTAQPFWISAAMLRRDLADLRQIVDPEHREPALDQMVLIGHSMGGLLSRLQTVPSGDAYWSTASDKPFEAVKAAPDVLERLQACFFFQPNPSIRRVVTIGTPHRGNSFSTQTTQWLAAKLIRLPTTLIQSQEALFRENKDLFGEKSLLRVTTSIDALSPKTPIFPVLVSSPQPPWVTYHNIIGMIPRQGLLGKLTSGDGVVSYDSAHMDDVASELIVPADHSSVHAHPLAVLEVRRILLQHLADLRAFPNSAPPTPIQTASSIMPH
jgi:pimeloyl-ACP methyl ester carboxylesterase